jgi:hypothetical protein
VVRPSDGWELQLLLTQQVLVPAAAEERFAQGPVAFGALMSTRGTEFLFTEARELAQKTLDEKCECVSAQMAASSANERLADEERNSNDIRVAVVYHYLEHRKWHHQVSTVHTNTRHHAAPGAPNIFGAATPSSTAPSTSASSSALESRSGLAWALGHLAFKGQEEERRYFSARGGHAQPDEPLRPPRRVDELYVGVYVLVGDARAPYSAAETHLGREQLESANDLSDTKLDETVFGENIAKRLTSQRVPRESTGLFVFVQDHYKGHAIRVSAA